MSRLIRWSPSIPDFIEDSDKFLEDLGLAGTAALPVDLYQTTDSIVVETLLPGMDPKQIQVSVENNILTIQAKTEHKTEIDEHDYYRKEIRSGSFHRSVALPVNVDHGKAEAEYKNGRLTIRLPKMSEQKSAHIEVKSS